MTAKPHYRVAFTLWSDGEAWAHVVEKTGTPPPWSAEPIRYRSYSTVMVILRNRGIKRIHVSQALGPARA